LLYVRVPRDRLIVRRPLSDVRAAAVARMTSFPKRAPSLSALLSPPSSSSACTHIPSAENSDRDEYTHEHTSTRRNFRRGVLLLLRRARVRYRRIHGGTSFRSRNTCFSLPVRTYIHVYTNLLWFYCVRGTDRASPSVRYYSYTAAGLTGRVVESVRLLRHTTTFIYIYIYIYI